MTITLTNRSRFSRRLPLVVLPVCLGLTAFAQETVTSPRPDGAQAPLRIFSPSGQACAPLAIISPGAGGTENGYSYLAEGLRDHGYLAVVMGHKKSGPGTLRSDIRNAGIHGGLKDMVTDPTLQNDRMLDLTTALAWADKQCHHPLKVLLGHSMGSDTVMFEGGAHTKLELNGRPITGKDRCDAYVALSPSGAGSIFASDSWKDIRKPLFILTARAIKDSKARGSGAPSLTTACPPDANGLV